MKRERRIGILVLLAALATIIVILSPIVDLAAGDGETVVLDGTSPE